MRFLASTAGMPDRLVAEAWRLTRPGGFVAAQEADFSTLRCFPPDPAWTTLVAAYRACFPFTDDDPEAHRVYRLMRAAGLDDVGYRPVLVGVRSGDAWQDYLPATVESLRPSILGAACFAGGGLDAALAACRAHLAEPDTVFTAFTRGADLGTRADGGLTVPIRAGRAARRARRAGRRSRRRRWSGARPRGRCGRSASPG